LGTKLSSLIDIATDYRFLVCGNYIAFYRIDGNDVYVIRILYGRRDYVKILFGELPKDGAQADS
jgi:plasmid stabilization system protein ParE